MSGTHKDPLLGHIVDWAESGDTSRESAEKELYDLWVSTFDRLWPRD